MTTDPLARYQALFERHVADGWRLLPADIRIWDSHTHVGVDEDGFTLSPDQLLAGMDAAGVQRVFTFPLNDPERVPAYRVPNDRVLEWCSHQPDRLVPFCRLDLTDDPIGEATRCLDRGARGIKLHPRAQRFTFGERALNPVFALAAERRVPILIHAGRGLPPIADDLQHLVERHPHAQLILAHAAIADLQHIGRTLRAHPNVTYDTSVWGVNDLRMLLATAAPEQIVWASDVPYGMAETSIFQVAHVLRHAGASVDHVRAVYWDNAERVSRGEPAPTLSPPLIDTTEQMSMQRMRISDYLMTTTALLWMRQPDMPGAIGLAVRACDAEASPELADVAELIETAGVVWAAGVAHETVEEITPYTRAAFRLLQIALTLLHTA
ncbi:MAG: amidohydrolase family protein [Gaiellales bacterium]